VGVEHTWTVDTSCTDTTTRIMLAHLLAAFATFLATLLLLLVSLSVPIIKSLDLFNLGIRFRDSSLINSGIDAVVKFGVWGYCRSAIEVS